MTESNRAVRAVDRVKTALALLSDDELRGDDFMARCPAHDDKTPSLRVTAEPGTVLLNCFAGCETERILELLDMTKSDLYDDRRQEDLQTTGTDFETTYIYHDENGQPLFKVVRTQGKNGTKGFKQQRRNGHGWDSRLGDARRVLYRLPEVIEAVAAGQPIYIVEGEKDAERLLAEGFIATTSPGGAGATKWDKTDTSALDGAHAVIIADNDQVGRDHAHHIANSLTGRAKSIRVVDLEGLVEPKGDISDWLDSGQTAESLVALVEKAEEWRKQHTRFDGAEPMNTVGDLSVYTADSLRSWAGKPAKWRVRGALIAGTHLVVGGAKKVLKTTLISGEMAISVANGIPWLDHPSFKVEAQTPVIVVINEGTKSYIRTLERIASRLNLASLGPVYVIEANGVKAGSPDLGNLIHRICADTGAGMIIYDAWYGFVGGAADAANLFSMRDVFGVVQAMAERVGADPVIVHHLKKGFRGRPDLDHLAWAGVAEWADSWILVTHRSTARPDDGEYRLGVVAGSRQWGEQNYELDASFGPIDMDHGGYTDPPLWTVAKVDAQRSEAWGKNGTQAADPNSALVDFLNKHPYEYTKSQLGTLVDAGDQKVRAAVDLLIDAGEIRSVHMRRDENGTIKTRDLIGPAAIDPKTIEQGRSVGIDKNQPTNVGQPVAGSSLGAAASTGNSSSFANNGHPSDVEIVRQQRDLGPTTVDNGQDTDVHTRLTDEAAWTGE